MEAAPTEAALVPQIGQSQAGHPSPPTRSPTVYTPVPGIKGAKRRSAMAYGHP